VSMDIERWVSPQSRIVWHVVFVAFLAGACEGDPTSAAVGVACIPYEELDSSFAGFAVDETSLETSHVDCAAESVCLIHRFQGRVSCPYGQTEDALTFPSSDPRRCVLPWKATEPVNVTVQPQIVERSGREGVYCSALCADSQGHRNDGRRYHDCPSGFHCENVDASALAPKNLSGSYCIRDGTPSLVGVSTEVCELDSGGSSGNCGDARASF
jgi:hypothetical protein